MAIQSNKVSVHGSQMHYLSEGTGKPIVFLHGAPVSSYVWRNIIPKVARKALCIAPDFIGMGESDKPAIEYTIQDHIKYFEGFAKALELKEITLVMLGLGSVVGMAYAQKYPEKISGLVFTDAYLRLEKNRQDISLIFEKLKVLAQDDSTKLKKMLTDAFWKTLQDNPYVNPDSKVIPIIEKYSEWLEKTPVKKLLLYGGPGFITTKTAVSWAIKTLPNLKAVDLGPAATMSDAMAAKFSEALLSWL